MRNPYVVLGISNNATEDQIKCAFRRLAKETHPDMNAGSTDSINKFHEISEAYAFLIDSNNRKDFDEAFDNRTSGRSDYRYDFKSRQENSLNEEIIRIYIAKITEELSEYKKMATKAINIGLAWFLGGITISFFSYQAALGSGGGQYFVAIGAIFFGGIQAVKGMIASSNINKLINEAEKRLWDDLDKQFYNNTKARSDYTEHRKTEYTRNTKADNQYEEGNSESKEDRYENNKDSNSESEETSMDETYSNLKQESKKKDYILISFVMVVLVIVLIINLGQVSDNEQTTIKVETENNKRVEENVLLTDNDIHEMLQIIDNAKAEIFIKKTYKDSNLNKIVNVFRNLGYSVDGVNHNNLNELIA